jgi:hypothetical protein
MKPERKRIAENGHGFAGRQWKSPGGWPQGSRYAHAHNADEQQYDDRLKRPLRGGTEADVYEATLFAIAETGPKSALTYDEIRSKLNTILADKVPQKHEVTSALKHLSRISGEGGAEKGLDWDESKRTLHITDPYLRFYLRWQIRQSNGANAVLALASEWMSGSVFPADCAASVSQAVAQVEEIHFGPWLAIVYVKSAINAM